MEVRILRHGIILAMCVYDTENNNRICYTAKTLESLLKTVNFNRHTLFISDNGSCGATHDLYKTFTEQFKAKFSEKNLIICYNGKNLGTAKGINKAIQIRRSSQKVLKLDDDLYFPQEGWLDQMEDAMDRAGDIGILGAKRYELEQHPEHKNPAYKSRLRMLPHERGQNWVVVEYAEEIIGTCILLSDKLLNRVGGLQQIDFYGWDDSNISLRSKMAGFKNAFLPHIPIIHLDTGEGEYVKLKQDHATETIEAWQEMKEDYELGVRDVFIDPFED